MESLSTRRWTAAVYVLGAVFFTSLAAGVLSARMAMHPALGWLLRGFIGLLFGSLSLGALLAASRELRPLRPAPPRLLERCLCCGEVTPADRLCPVCAQPSHDRAAAIRVGHARWIDAVLVSMGSTALLCLGLFVAVGPYVDGERRLWVLLAVGALALLLLFVGAAGAFGSLLDAVQQWRVGAELTCGWSDAARVLRGDGTTRHGALSRFEGHGSLRAPLREDVSLEAGYRQAPDTRLAETLATFEAAGLWVYAYETSWRWILEQDGEREDLRRSTGRLVSVDPCTDGEWREGGLHEAVAASLWRIAADGMTLAALIELFEDERHLRAQSDAHAEALRESGVRVLPARVAAIQAALDEEARGHGAA